jgi:hypothetical protein
VPGCSPLLRRTLLPTLPPAFAGIEFADWALYLLLGERGAIVYLDEVLGVYRVHPGGAWSGLSYDQQEQRVLGFYDQLAGILPGREHELRREADRLRRLGRIRSIRRSSLCAAEQRDANLSTRINSILDGHVPDASCVIWVEPALEPVGVNRKLLSFPEIPARTWKRFGTGATGAKPAPWIAPGYVYELRLRGGSDLTETQVAVTVVAESADVPASTASTGDSSRPDAGHLSADPTPARMLGTHASTEVAWATQDGSTGQVEVSAFPLEEGMPSDDEEAVAGAELLKQQGGEFLFLPRQCLPWLELYPGLAHYLDDRHRLVVEEPAVGRLYDLRDEIA